MYCTIMQQNVFAEEIKSNGYFVVTNYCVLYIYIISMLDYTNISTMINMARINTNQNIFTGLHLHKVNRQGTEIVFLSIRFSIQIIFVLSYFIFEIHIHMFFINISPHKLG